MCYFNRLTRVARWLADYPEWLQFYWDFIKPPRNDEIALQHFFFCLQQCKNFFSSSFVRHAIFFFQQALAENFFQNHPSPPPPQKLNGRPLKRHKLTVNRKRCFSLLLGRVPFDQNFRFELPNFSYAEWNGIFLDYE